MSKDAGAEDLADLILCSTVEYMVERRHDVPVAGHEQPYLWQRRAAYFEELHRRHDAAGASTDTLFNDRHSLVDDHEKEG